MKPNWQPKTWRHRDWIDMQDSYDEKTEDTDFLLPELRNVTDKLTMLRNLIGDKHCEDIGYMEDNEPNMDWGLVNAWINDVFLHEIPPARGTLELANKLWRKYN